MQHSLDSIRPDYEIINKGIINTFSKPPFRRGINMHVGSNHLDVVRATYDHIQLARWTTDCIKTGRPENSPKVRPKDLDHPPMSDQKNVRSGDRCGFKAFQYCCVSGEGSGEHLIVNARERRERRHASHRNKEIHIQIIFSAFNLWTFYYYIIFHSQHSFQQPYELWIKPAFFWRPAEGAKSESDCMKVGEEMSQFSLKVLTLSIFQDRFSVSQPQLQNTERSFKWVFSHLG